MAQKSSNRQRLLSINSLSSLLYNTVSPNGYSNYFDGVIFWFSYIQLCALSLDFQINQSFFDTPANSSTSMREIVSVLSGSIAMRRNQIGQEIHSWIFWILFAYLCLIGLAILFVGLKFYRHRNSNAILGIPSLPYLLSFHTQIIFLSTYIHFQNLIWQPVPITSVLYLNKDVTRILSLIAMIINMTIFVIGQTLRIECFNSLKTWIGSTVLSPHALTALTKLIFSLLIPLQAYQANDTLLYGLCAWLCLISFFMMSNVYYYVPYLSKIVNQLILFFFGFILSVNSLSIGSKFASNSTNFANINLIVVDIVLICLLGKNLINLLDKVLLSSLKSTINPPKNLPKEDIFKWLCLISHTFNGFSLTLDESKKNKKEIELWGMLKLFCNANKNCKGKNCVICNCFVYENRNQIQQMGLQFNELKQQVFENIFHRGITQCKLKASTMIAYIYYLTTQEQFDRRSFTLLSSLLQRSTEDFSYLQKIQVMRLNQMINDRLNSMQEAAETGIDMKEFIKFQSNCESIQTLIQEATNKFKKFWEVYEYEENNPNLLVSINNKIEKLDSKIENRWSSFSKSPSNMTNEIVGLYCMYSYVVRNRFYSAELLMNKFNLYKSQIMLKDISSEGSLKNFIKSSDSITLLISMEQKSLGQILRAQGKVTSKLGWSPKELEKQNINDTIMPKPFRSIHQEIMTEYLAMKNQSAIDKTLKVFLTTKKGTMCQSNIYFSYYPILEGGLKYIAFIRPIESSEDYILTDSNGLILENSTSVEVMYEIQAQANQKRIFSQQTRKFNIERNCSAVSHDESSLLSENYKFFEQTSPSGEDVAPTTTKSTKLQRYIQLASNSEDDPKIQSMSICQRLQQSAFIDLNINNSVQSAKVLSISMKSQKYFFLMLRKNFYNDLDEDEEQKEEKDDKSDIFEKEEAMTKLLSKLKEKRNSAQSNKMGAPMDSAIIPKRSSLFSQVQKQHPNNNKATTSQSSKSSENMGDIGNEVDCIAQPTMYSPIIQSSTRQKMLETTDSPKQSSSPKILSQTDCLQVKQLHLKQQNFKQRDLEKQTTLKASGTKQKTGQQQPMQISEFQSSVRQSIKKKHLQKIEIAIHTMPKYHGLRLTKSIAFLLYILSSGLLFGYLIQFSKTFDQVLNNARLLTLMTAQASQILTFHASLKKIQLMYRNLVRSDIVGTDSDEIILKELNTRIPEYRNQIMEVMGAFSKVATNLQRQISAQTIKIKLEEGHGETGDVGNAVDEHGNHHRRRMLSQFQYDFDGIEFQIRNMISRSGNSINSILSDTTDTINTINAINAINTVNAINSVNIPHSTQNVLNSPQRLLSGFEHGTGNHGHGHGQDHVHGFHEHDQTTSVTRYASLIQHAITEMGDGHNKELVRHELELVTKYGVNEYISGIDFSEQLLIKTTSQLIEDSGSYITFSLVASCLLSVIFISLVVYIQAKFTKQRNQFLTLLYRTGPEKAKTSEFKKAMQYTETIHSNNMLSLIKQVHSASPLSTFSKKIQDSLSYKESVKKRKFTSEEDLKTTPLNKKLAISVVFSSIFTLLLITAFAILFALQGSESGKQEIKNQLEDVYNVNRLYRDTVISYSTMFDYIGDDKTTTIRNNPIESEMNSVLKALTVHRGLLVRLSEQSTNPLVYPMIKGNLCIVVTQSTALKQRCENQDKKQTQSGLIGLIDYTYNILATMKSSYDSSHRDIHEREAYLNDKKLIDLSYYEADYFRAVFNKLIEIMQKETLDRIDERELKALVIIITFMVLFIFIGGGLFGYIISRLVAERNEIRMIVRSVPLPIISSSPQFKQYLLKNCNKMLDSYQHLF